MESFEKLGVFYLGRLLDTQSGNVSRDYLLYDSRDLVTHAVCVGMTGSGKTGMCLSLLEEAAIDSIPAIVIDPKGDLGNLLLTFPDLSAAEFRPWINEEEARLKGKSPDEFAVAEADRWRAGLAEWEQNGERIRRLKSSADFAIYTPGSTAGLPVSIASSFEAPSQQSLQDPELLRERIATTASGLLGLLGVQADPLRSREHILIAKILEQEWTSGRSLDLASLIQMIQSPPVQRVGVFDLESFYPAAERIQLAMMLNNLLAAPGFSTWLEGEALDIGRMLHTNEGRPRVSIFSIAHLSDDERMFFVTMLLSQTIGWMRSQPGTASLRAMLYMDEIFGFFPPVAEPPSKKPLLTLLKQARAFGLGVVLATQNPVDLDYKGLANTGTWFIGRLQTERDRERLLDGLTGPDSAKVSMDRTRLSELLANLRPRTFLMQNAHEDHPVLFNSRWALSYLAGPLTRGQIRQLMQDRTPTPPTISPAASPKPEMPAPQPAGVLRILPQFPSEVRQFFAPLSTPAPPQVVYRPFLFASAKFQVINNTLGISSSQITSHILELQSNMTTAPWQEAKAFAAGVEELGRQPVEGAAYSQVPTALFEPRRFQSIQKGYADFVYRDAQTVLWKSNIFKTTSQPGESERDFRIRLQQLARERRDFEMDRIRQRYSGKTAVLQQRLLRAQQRIAKEQEQYSQQWVQTGISVGATVLGALMGRKSLSIGTLGRAATATRQASRIGREKEDVQMAQEEMATVQQQLGDLDRQMQQEADRLAQSFDPQSETLQQIVVRPAKSDILIQQVGILWMPS